MSASCSDDDELLVNYHDALIYRRDLRVLENPTAWLNSDCIHFQLLWLQNSTNLNDVLLMDPSVTSFLVHQCTEEDEMEEFRASHENFHGKHWIYLPINDAMFTENAEWWNSHGTHWSLLRIRIPNGGNSSCIAEHYNSMEGTNQAAAQSVFAKMRIALNKSFFPLRTVSGVPQQQNGYDCGPHVLLMIQELLQGKDVASIANLLRNNSSACSDLRHRIAQTVMELAAQR